MFKILIVEDDVKIAGIIRENLERWGYRGFVAENLQNVMEEFGRVKPDLVLLDIVLPYYDGFYWCDKIRQVSKLPIIFISSRTSNMDIIMAVNMGGDDFITKPFSLEVLMAKINAILRRTYSYIADSPAQLIEHQGAVLNLSDGTLKHLDRSIELTKNEFRILQLLLKQHGTIITREKIMRALWEDENFVDDNTLTVNVNRLRKKLSDIGLEEFIITKKNQGYLIP